MNLLEAKTFIINEIYSFIKLLVSIPLFVKSYIIITFFLCILNLFIKEISSNISIIPSKIISQYQFWRLLTSTFMTTNIYKIILGLLSWIKLASSLENILGTIKYFIIFMINSTIIHLLYCLFYYLLSSIKIKNRNKFLLNNEINNIENNGMWGIIICEFILLCLNNSQSKIKLLLFPISIKAKYYPLIFILLLSLFDSFKLDLQLLSGIFYGIFYYYLLKNRINIPDSFIYFIEDNFCLKLTQIKIFIKCKRNLSNNIIFSNNKDSYSPVQITTSSNLNNNSNNL